MAVRREYVEDLYRNLLGREGSEGEIEGHLNNPGGEAGLDAFFRGSPEYTSTHGGQATWQDVGGVVTPTQSAPPSQDSNPYQVQSQAPSYSYSTPQSSSASTDANARARQGLKGVYQQFLGRAPSEQELDNWLSGAFGYGSGANDYDKFVNAIMGSHEARGYRPAAPSGSYKSIEYWQSQGVPTSDIFDPMTGQLRPGWTRTANGYERGGAGSATVPPFTGFTPRHDYTAFNTSREQDPNKSAKDAFVMVSNAAPPPPFHDKKQLAAWFNQYIRPGFEALGHRVISVGDDSFTYTNHEGTFTVDFAQNAGAPRGSMQQRLQWGATPADDATRARYPNGTGGTLGSLRDLYGALGQQYGGPGGPGITTGPLQQVGQDPLSLLITGALANFIGSEGSTGFGGDVQRALSGLMERGGELPADQVARRFESARELLDKGRRTMINDARGDLASRNLLSEPGIPQGAEIGAIDRITDKLAPEFSRALRDIYADESAKSDARMMTALQMATGFSTDQARNLLAGIGEGTARQSALADLALRELQTNMAWNQFLAQFGLERDKVMYDIQNGGIDQLMPLLQAFMQLGGMANAGYV